jgi:hypothetical protein
MNTLKKKWEEVPPEVEQKYLTKAAYLVDRKYVLDKTVEQLAKEMYLKENN